MKPEHGFTQKHKKAVAIAAAAVFLLFITVVFVYVGVPMVRLASEPDAFRNWVDARGLWGKLAYMGMVYLQVLVALIPGEPLEIGGGYAFGAVEGTLLCLLGGTLGSLTVFFFVRRFGIQFVEVFFPREKLHSLRFLQRSRKRDVLFMLIFLLPGTPKDMLCYFAGLTDIRLSTWLFICSVGRIPSVVSSTIGGNMLGSERYLIAAIVLAATLLVSGLGLLVYRCICTHNKKS